MAQLQELGAAAAGSGLAIVGGTCCRHYLPRLPGLIGKKGIAAIVGHGPPISVLLPPGSG